MQGLELGLFALDWTPLMWFSVRLNGARALEKVIYSQLQSADLTNVIETFAVPGEANPMAAWRQQFWAAQELTLQRALIGRSNPHKICCLFAFCPWV